MQKMEMLVYKNQDIVKFPHQKFEMSFGTLASKLQVNDFIGLVNSSKDGSIKKIGVLCKIIGKMNQLFLGRSNSFPVTIFQVQALFRMKISEDEKKMDKNSQYFRSKIEIVEDEISK